MPQASSSAFDFSVDDMVLMGRTAHLRAFAAPGARDLFVAGSSRAKALAVYDKVDTLLGIVVGAIQATRGGGLDTTLSVVTVTLFALPGYWLGLMLVMLFTYWARALPAFGAAG